MNSKEMQKLKQVLKPLVKECIREAIFEEGVLAELVAEVATGITRAPLVEQKVERPPVMQVDDTARKQRLNETRKKMREAIGSTAYSGVDIFEGTEPLSSGGQLGATTPRGPLSNVDPRDPGVNIDSLVGLFGDKWSALK